MIVENERDLEGLKRIGAVVRDVLARLGQEARAGVTPLELDRLAGEMLDRAGARSAPILCYEFPGHSCISVNDCAAHGIPDDRPLRDGDLVNIDVSAELEGYFADSGASFSIGPADRQTAHLLTTTRDAQRKAMYKARAGEPVNAVGRFLEREAANHGYRIIEGLNGHGVGRAIHEEPSIPNQYVPNLKSRFQAGQVVTIEPFFATKATHYYEDDDGWSLRLDGGGLVAQFEHTFVITRGAPIIITA